MRSSTSDDEIALDTPLADYSELALARALLKHNVPIQLTISYAPPHLSPPDGDMVIVGVRSQKLSSKKACLWVRFISPPSLLGEQIQLYPKIEPKKGSAQGQEFSLHTALAHSFTSSRQDAFRSRSTLEDSILHHCCPHGIFRCNARRNQVQRG